MSSEQGKLRIDDHPPPPITVPPSLNDWINWRQVITHLWQTSQTYEEVRAVMIREYCFIDSCERSKLTSLLSSLSSFKSHLKEWGLRKSATKEDVFYLAMVIRDRGLDEVNPSQRPLFFLHGRQYPYYCVARTLKRCGLTLDSFGTTPPKPSHILVVDPEIPRSPATPAEFALSEKILFQTHYIYDDYLVETRLGSSDLKKCQSAFGWALQAVNEGDYICAQTHFSSSLHYLAEALNQRSQHLLPLICVSTALAYAEPSHLAKGFLDTFFRCALDLVRYYCGEQHPFAIVLETLSNTQWTGHDAESILSSIIGDDSGSQFRWPRVYHFFELMRLQAQVMVAQGRHQESERLLGRVIRELWSPDIDLDNAEAILHSIARMMSQVNSSEAVKWIRAWIPQVKNMIAQRAPDRIRECLNSLVVEYYMVVSIRQLHTETRTEDQ
ncbi:hypothetical protein TARUN_9021 [Trichoderma arundinaceum]|uniref:Clr5 domain-containing protein n=1 Tax=Trichoderma arundinaceum TaxID=490622 RepID=A0A395NAW0_TRIAR|nr:hypothetical protein TARUN_9021 [Trichoderma arundinaceum]